MSAPKPQCSRPDCTRAVQVKGMCRGHYNSRRTKRVRAGLWERRPDSVGTSRRLRALVAIGYSQSELAARLGVPQPYISRLAVQARPRVQPATAEKVRRIYDELSMIPGPSNRARIRGRKLGWAPPLAWDEETIDDPAAGADFGPEGRGSWVHRYHDERACGYSDLEIAKRRGIAASSLLRGMLRHGLTPSEELTAEANREKHHRTRAAS